ncbi:MAG: tRNA (adenosine(37)-N6)-dimethylallyltransferase MiaA [Lachnospiraceae bacterium]|nr:tRNA (adenosine(37)-N6)-dimethylallyltransferase MiaA [Lachnospiraceae bacterium]
MDKKPLIIIAGPTAVGKTKAAVQLAKDIGGEIISADSMQVYRYMDIGSAKVTEEEKEEIPHYLIDVLDPKEPFNVTVFQKLAKEAIGKVYENGHVPILCGGTGFYIQSVLFDIDFTENGEDRSYRHALEALAEQEGADVIRKMLEKVDPEGAAAIEGPNVKRLIRALEYYRETGEPISAHNRKERAKESPYDYRYYVLTMDRKQLYARIDLRVDRMMEAGLLKEVEWLKAYGCTKDMTSMQGLGYKQLFEYEDLQAAVERIKQETRHFAKRQLTWFKREKQIRYINVLEEDVRNVLRDGFER